MLPAQRKPFRTYLWVLLHEVLVSVTPSVIGEQAILAEYFWLPEMAGVVSLLSWGRKWELVLPGMLGMVVFSVDSFVGIDGDIPGAVVSVAAEVKLFRSVDPEVTEK